MTTSRDGRAAKPTVRGALHWMWQISPASYAVAATTFSTSLPVEGRYFEPLASATLTSVWGSRQISGLVSKTAKNSILPGATEVRRKDRNAANDASVAALRDVVADRI